MPSVVVQGLTEFFGAVLSFFLNFSLHSLKVVFNIAFISRAFSLLVPSVINFSKVKLVLVDAAAVVYALSEPLKGAFNDLMQFFNFFETVLRNFDLPYLWQQETICGGAVKWMQFFAVVIFFACLGFVMISDLMYFIGIKSHSLEKKLKLKILEKMAEKMVNMMVALVFYASQVMAFVGLQMLLDGANINDSSSVGCSGRDKTALTAARVFTVIFLIIIFVPAIMIVGGGSATFLKNGGKCAGAKDNALTLLIKALKHVLFLTLGIWDNEMLEIHDIKKRANKYDDDLDDDNSRQTDTCIITAKTQALFWVAFPGTVIIAKVTELMNDSIVFGKLEYHEPRWTRLKNWIFNVAELVETILLVFAPHISVAVILLLSVLIRFLIDLFGSWYHAFQVVFGSEISQLFEKNDTQFAVDLGNMQSPNKEDVEKGVNMAVEQVTIVKTEVSQQAVDTEVAKPVEVVKAEVAKPVDMVKEETAQQVTAVVGTEAASIGLQVAEDEHVQAAVLGVESIALEVGQEEGEELIAPAQQAVPQDETQPSGP